MAVKAREDKRMIGAIDIGGTKIAIGLVDDSGRVLSRSACATNPEGGYQEALARIANSLRALLAAERGTLQGIGIGSTGPVNPFTGEFEEVNFFPTWKGEKPVADLERLFGVSAALENDGDASALAEAAWGAGRNKKRLIYVTVGTGIGAGVILDGKLYRGVDGSHPEIGHHVIDASAGPLCDCGFHGCWESLATGPAMVAWLKKNAPAEYPHIEGITAKKICELALAGDELARACVDREGRYLGLGLANLVTLFAPDGIVLGGGVMQNAVLFLEQIRRTICQCCRFVPYEKTEISLASLGEDANLIGAARVWHHRFAEGRQDRV